MKKGILITAVSVVVIFLAVELPAAEKHLGFAEFVTGTLIALGLIEATAIWIIAHAKPSAPKTDNYKDIEGFKMS